MENLVQFFSGRPVAVIMSSFGLLLWGASAVLILPRERLPPVRVPRTIIEARYPGMGAEEIRSMLALPLEDAVSSVKGIQSMRTVCRDGSATIMLDSQWGEDPDRAAARAREAVDAIYPSLPEGAEKPVVFAADSAEQPIAIVGITFRSGDLVAARRLADYELRSRFRRIEGVGRTVIVGGAERELEVSVDAYRAAQKGLSVNDVARILAAECVDVPAGQIEKGDLEVVVVSKGRPASLAELSHLVVGGPRGPLELAEIAEVAIAESPRKSVFLTGEGEAVAVELYPRPGADPVATARLIREEVASCADTFARDARIEVLADYSRPISRGIADLLSAAVAGALAAIAVLAVFQRDLRASLLIALTIPVSTAASFVALSLLGKTLNAMSLSGLALSIGMLSDNAVVVLSGLTSTFGSFPRCPSASAVAGSAASAISATLASTITTIVVFLPILCIPGPIGAIFSDLAVTLITAVAAGWVLALFALPSLYRVVWQPRTSRLEWRIETAYRRLLRIAFRYPALVLAAALSLSILGGYLVLSREFEFLGNGPVDEVILELSFPAGTAMERIGREGIEVAGRLASLPELKSVFGRAGAEEEEIERRSDTGYRAERLRFHCGIGEGADADSMKSLILSKAEDLVPPHCSWRLTTPVDPVCRALGLTGSRTLAVFGDSPEEVQERIRSFSRQHYALLKTATSSISVTPSETRPELRIVPDRESAAALGVSLSNAALNLRTATEGGVAARLELDGRCLDVRVFGNEANGREGGSIEDIPVAVGAVPLGLRSFARTVSLDRQAALVRFDRRDVAYIEAIPIPGAEKRLDEILRDVSVKHGFARADESTFARYGTDLVLTVFLVLILLYLTMGAQFESYSAPLLFMTTIPLALAGVGPALQATGSSLDAATAVGMIAMAGNAVNNAIILFDTASRKFQDGASAVIASYAGAGKRVRPVLITALTAMFALLPIALRASSAAQRGMAAAMIGGTFGSTVLTLVVTPVLLRNVCFRRKR